MSILGTLALMATSGCGRDDRPLESPPASVEFACRNIQLADLSVFQPGKGRREVLAALDERGNFEFAYRESGGDEVMCLSYAVCREPGPLAESAYVVWAIFRNDRFEKLVDWVKPELEQIPYDGTTMSRYRRLSVVENLGRATSAASKTPVDLAGLRATLEQPPRKVQPDWGLTIAALAFAEPLHERMARSLEENVHLRAKFNGTSAKIGSTMEEVERTYGPPKKAWNDGGYSVRSYGTDSNIDLLPGLRFSNVVVAYEDSRVEVVFSNEFVPAILREE